jgi:hypothetical protein
MFAGALYCFSHQRSSEGHSLAYYGDPTPLKFQKSAIATVGQKFAAMEFVFGQLILKLKAPYSSRRAEKSSRHRNTQTARHLTLRFS